MMRSRLSLAPYYTDSCSGAHALDTLLVTGDQAATTCGGVVWVCCGENGDIAMMLVKGNGDFGAALSTV
jgi:hypothetical protein|eukprot:COSAG06_NODE_5765_length_3284_cov_14.119623_4_plen_69_part_00